MANPETKNSIEEISVIHISEMSKIAREEVEKIVGKKSREFQGNFRGFAVIRMVSSSPMRVGGIEPIEGTDVDWYRNRSANSEIDISDIF